MDKIKYHRGNTEEELRPRFGSNVAYTFDKMKHLYFENTKYLSTQSKIDFIDSELLDCETFKTNPNLRDMIASNIELKTFTVNVFRETNQLYIRFLEDELDKLKKTFREQEDKTKQSRFEFTNNLDHVSEEKVYEYFHEKLVKGKFINEDTLHEYIKLAFEEQTTPTEKFNFFRDQTRTNSKIKKIYYNYWNELAGHQYGTKEKYVKLYCHYFNGFKFESEKTNFSK
jgi:hypothetical protein